MINTAKKIILNSNNWPSFCENLRQLGNLPEHKKLKGETFELFSKYFLQSHPIFCTKLKSVWLHTEIPKDVVELLDLPVPEIGVDLVAEDIDQNFYLIQCKFHQEETQNVTYDELSTFFSISERENTYKKISHRLVLTSANKVTDRVIKLHSEKLGFVCSDMFEGITTEQFSNIRKLAQDDKISFRPLKPRPHQSRAIANAEDYFKNCGNSSGKLIHPCGAGKSLTGFWIAQNLRANSILIAVPSLALVKQTLETWTREAIANHIELRYMAVCSDAEVTQADDPAINKHEMSVGVTTDEEEICSFLRNKTQNLKLIITTYQSGRVLASATSRINFRFDLGIFDEAHKTAGNKSKTFSALLNRSQIRINHRIFMTATERLFKGDTSDFNSMDNAEVYGEVFDQLSFKNALEQKPAILCDYKVVTIAVTEQEIINFINTNQLTKINGTNYSFEADANTIAALLSLRKLIDEREIKHAISFHRSIKRAEEFQQLNTLINERSSELAKIQTFHVSGKQSSGQRKTEIEKFRSAKPSLVSNARCLTEGVDIPEVDAVLFADPKQSVVDIVQAAGRAMRLHPDKQVGHIIIPVILSASAIDVDSVFKEIISVIAALGINDDRIIEEAKTLAQNHPQNSEGILEFVEYSTTMQIDFSKLTEDLKIRIWDRLSFAKSIIGESNFAKWMREQTSLSEKTIRNYSQAVRRISNDLVKMNLAYSTLEEITNQANLQRLKDDYFSVDEFKQLDVRGKGMYSAGFNRLIEYQKYQKSTD